MRGEIRSQPLLRVKGSTKNSGLQRTPKGTPLIRQVCNIPEFILLFQVTLTSLSPYIIESWYMISSVFDLESSRRSSVTCRRRDHLFPASVFLSSLPLNSILSEMVS